MGTWGTALYSDDLAADLRSEFRDHVGNGLSADEALDVLAAEYSTSLSDPDESSVFWLAIADTAWRLGRPLARATAEALRVVDTGADLRRWQDEKEARKRSDMLLKLAAKLRSPAPPTRRVTKPFVAKNVWEPGELVAYRLASGLWTLFRVIGHHVDKGGRHAICEPLDWTGQDLPDLRALPTLRVRSPVGSWHSQSPQFMLGEPRRKNDVDRFFRLAVRSTPAQQPGRCLVFVFPHVDRQLCEVFGVG